MSRLDHTRVMDILAEAMELAPPRRAGFLDSTCVGDPALRQRVEELLKFAVSAAGVFNAASEQVIQTDPEHIGHYTILEPIGEGGMAIVYKARQDRPVKRTVAIKLIKLGMDTRQFVARFEAERQALAMMDHPSVARVFEAGATETGRPYFVMEYVAGCSILEYCDRKRLDTRRRLELFTQVCDAVEHAHRKGILHRDIKSSNVLVAEIEDKPIPKVIDFGVAKALQQPLTDRTLQTEQGQLIGTPEYMSPEQAERGALDIDTRSDVYSLGVLLYELISGVQPISSEILRSGSYEQVQRIIRETDPPRPSTRLSSLDAEARTLVAQRRQVPLPALIRQLRSELEWIPLKAMRRDRDERYRSAAELADDIRNYLQGKPLLAGPESGWYRARKFLRRHKTGVAAAAAMVLLLIGGIIATTWQAVRAIHAEARAVEDRDSAQAMLDFLTDDVLSGATPERIPDVKVRDQIVSAMINPAADRVGERFHDRPIIEASVRETIRSVLVKIGRRDLALPHAEIALAIRRRKLGDDHLDTLTSLNNYASVIEKNGRVSEAEVLYRESLDRRRRVLGEEHPKTLMAMNNYAHVLWRLGRYAEAEPYNRAVLERRRETLGEDHPDTIMSLNNYASITESLGRDAEAELLYAKALAQYRRVLGPDHPQTIMAMNNYANVLRKLGRLDEAEPLFRQAAEDHRRVLGEDHPEALWSMTQYAVLLGRLGRHAQAEPIHRRVLELQRLRLGEDHPETLMSLNNIAVSLVALERIGEAETFSRRAFEGALANTSLGPAHEWTRDAANTHATCLDALGRHDEADAVRRGFDPPHSTTRP